MGHLPVQQRGETAPVGTGGCRTAGRRGRATPGARWGRRCAARRRRRRGRGAAPAAGGGTGRPSGRAARRRRRRTSVAARWANRSTSSAVQRRRRRGEVQRHGRGPPRRARPSAVTGCPRSPGPTRSRRTSCPNASARLVEPQRRGGPARRCPPRGDGLVLGPQRRLELTRRRLDQHHATDLGACPARAVNDHGSRALPTDDIRARSDTATGAPTVRRDEALEQLRHVRRRRACQRRVAALSPRNAQPGRPGGAAPRRRLGSIGW